MTAEPAERPTPAPVRGSAASSAKVSLTVSKERQAPGTGQSKQGEKATSDSVGKRLGNPHRQLPSDCFPKQRAPGPADHARGRRREAGASPKPSNRQDQVRVRAPAQQAGAKQPTKRSGGPRRGM